MTGLISLQFKGLSRVFSSTTIQKHKFFVVQLTLMVQLSHPFITTEKKNIGLTIRTFVGKVMSLVFNTLSRFVIAFFPRSKLLLTSWLQSPSTVILEPKKIKSVTASTFCSSLLNRPQPEITRYLWEVSVMKDRHKVSRRNTNNLTYADDTTLMA